ncbi:F0F1 ATP synthase subunit delta [Thioalkalivibrio sp. HK1]|uniref:F0F1 ATP synthase subunit delta n=1 Tax=Thioalkalivibrio sp. HK1 TaxID=1469245 RepID=UPI000472C2C8|nr:F0F1 ATP synthase subunit delta [Thioalkalivibrio sp. HK1]
MAESAGLARPYAIAAFRQAQDESALGEWGRMLDLLATIACDPSVHALIANPRIDRARLVDLFIEVGGEHLSATGCNFVRVIGHYGRFALLPEIARLFERERAAHEGRSEVHVTGAFELDEAQRAEIIQVMEKHLGKKVSLVFDLDPGLIGGVVIRAGDLVIDASIRGRLGQLAQSLV